MPKNLKFMTLLALGGLLAACSTAEVERMSVSGGEFEKGLHSGYIALAKAEYDEDDWGDGGNFVDRAKAAAMGTPTEPEALEARELKKKHSEPLSAARFRLVSALRDGGAKKAGDLAAKAQVSFDCWMQEAEEDLQPEDIAKCRDEFFANMARLEAAVSPSATPSPVAAKPAPAPKMAAAKPAAPQKRDYVVYFDLDSKTVKPEMVNVVNDAASFAKRIKAASVYVAGYTDRAGSRKYNQALAKARADEVAATLAKAGTRKGSVGVVVYGEDQPAVDTADGKTEGRNRRVVISVVY